MCPTSCPSPIQLHLTPPYPTTLYCHLTTNTQHQYHYHATAHQGSDANNTSTIWAKCLAEHCGSPENDSQRRGGRGQNYYHNGIGGGAAPECLLRGGANLPKCLATAARALKHCASPEKVAQWRVCVCVCVGGGGGGTLTHFVRLKKFVLNIK